MTSCQAQPRQQRAQRGTQGPPSGNQMPEHRTPAQQIIVTSFWAQYACHSMMKSSAYGSCHLCQPRMSSTQCHYLWFGRILAEPGLFCEKHKQTRA